LLVVARESACAHRWIESEKHCRDLGEGAICEWYQRWWRSFLRYRHLEHLMGDVRWQEFEPAQLGLLPPVLRLHGAIAERIVGMYLDGGENLDIIYWAVRENVDMTAVLACLNAINMNSTRVDPYSRAASQPPRHEHF